MKRFLLILAALPLLLCSCGRQSSAHEVLCRASGLITFPASYILYSSEAAGGEGYLDSDNMALLYPDGTDVRALCADYAVLVGSTDIPYEVHILHARARSCRDELESALTYRKDMIQLRKNEGFRAGYREGVESARVFCRGNYAFLIVAPDADKTAAAIKKVL